MVKNLLEGKKGIIFGALNDRSIAWKVAEKAVEQGAQITLSNTAVACRMGEIKELSARLNAPLIAADATNVDDLKEVFRQSMEIFGGKVDFVLHSIGMSLNVRKKRTYNDLDYDFLNKTLDISSISFHKMLQTAYQMDAINEWGSIVALTYIASQRTLFGYNDMADAKGDRRHHHGTRVVALVHPAKEQAAKHQLLDEAHEAHGKHGTQALQGGSRHHDAKEQLLGCHDGKR